MKNGIVGAASIVLLLLATGCQQPKVTHKGFRNELRKGTVFDAEVRVLPDDYAPLLTASSGEILHKPVPLIGADGRRVDPSAGTGAQPTGRSSTGATTPAADSDQARRLRTLALQAYKEGAFGIARDLALESLRARPSDAELHLLVASSVAAQFEQWKADPALQEKMAALAADSAREAWKHGQQDLAMYQTKALEPLTTQPAWIGAIGELKARAERIKAGK